MNTSAANETMMGWPLGLQKQREVAEALNKAAEAKASRAIGCWCAETGFGLLVEVFDGVPVFWHCTGPMTIDQAKTWLAGMATANEVEGQTIQ